MGAMKELHIEAMNLEIAWFGFLEELLGQATIGSARALKVGETPSDEDEWEAKRRVPDLSFTPNGRRWPTAVEFRMFRWRSDLIGRIGASLVHVRELLSGGRYERGLLIVSVELNARERELASKACGSDIDLWDLADLRRVAASDSFLPEKLDDLVNATGMDSFDPVGSASVFSAFGTGALIAAKLRNTPAGQDGWQAFESTCHDAVKLLFGRELHKLVTQNRTTDGLHRMDLIGRIRPEPNSFWALLATDFATRYVVFDAKNYAEAIGQDAIDSTHRYLSAAALRTVAILIARNGASKHAVASSSGVLRESRKFVMVIGMDDLCAMLKGYDIGEPPENRLFDRMDETLMAIGR